MIYKNEYPRPQFKRKEWKNLNGEWQFAFDDDQVGLNEKWYLKEKLPQKIQVPFCFQSKLSGIDDQSFHDAIWYKRSFTVPASWKELVYLHFAAVDYECYVYVNQELVGHHVGGSTSFKFDITRFLNYKKEEVVVYVIDPSTDEFIPRGKQYWKEESAGIWYTRTSGIWQTVWLEPVKKHHIEKLLITPNIDDGKVELKIHTSSVLQKEVLIEIYEDGKCIHTVTSQIEKDLKLHLDVWNGNIFNTNLHHHGKTWWPENPFLYDLRVTLQVSGTVADEVESYFGMRKVHYENGMFYLNNRPYYLKLVLDQGYFPNGLLTAPSDADLVQDIELSKQMGFNGCRKHQKVEEERFLYHADRLGFIVWSEMPAAANFSRDYALAMTKEWADVLERDYNHPSIVCWVPLNESWGVPQIKTNLLQQHHALALYHLTKSYDQTRLVISNDGWELVQTDICAIHNYCHGESTNTLAHEAFAKSLRTKVDLLNSEPAGRPIYAQGFSHDDRVPIMLTEFGGISFKEESGNGWGYTSVANGSDFVAEYKRIMQAINQSEALVGFCYTQLTDVEQEINGLLTYDRKPKVDLKIIKQINDQVSLHVPKRK